jgi:hypothetical protein
MNEKLSEDEWRLVHFFRCLSLQKQSDVLLDVGSQAFEECIPDKSLYELMPHAAGVEPEGIKYIDDEYSICHVIYCGIEETGDPKHYLIGASYWDEEQTIPRFVAGAEQAALEQGSFFNYDKEFAREYINAWRREIVFACTHNKKIIDVNQ